jgi:glucose-1-phosphate thymidylyltransferase
MEIIGLIPAGGRATRLGKIPCSKEIYPLFRGKSSDEGSAEIRVISEYLINSYRIAGINNIYFILRKGKWDIPAYYGDGSDFGVNISYLIMNLPYGTPFTLDQAYPFTKNKYIALGYPDIIVEPAEAFIKIKEKISETKAEAVLGLFPVENYLGWDMVEFDSRGKIKNIIIKQERPDLKYGWTIALWNPSFWEFMHEYIQDIISRGGDGKVMIKGQMSRELYPGDIFMEAMKAGLNVEAVIFGKGRCIDIGDPENIGKIFT